MSRQLLVSQYTQPFDTMSNLLKALTIVNRVYCKDQDNVQQITTLYNQLTESKLNSNEIHKFIQMNNTYPALYPSDFINEFAVFNQQIKIHSDVLNHHSIVITSPATNCDYCPSDGQTDWFNIKSPIFTKDALLFNFDSIGKNIYFTY